MSSIPQVALLVETSREYACGLLRGIARYHQEHGPWSMYFQPHGLNDPVPNWFKEWRGDGILARINNQELADTILDMGIPAVDVRGIIPNLGIPSIGVDNKPVALAFEHLKGCGLENFGFYGAPQGESSNQDQRRIYFEQLVERVGFRCHLYMDDLKDSHESKWDKQQDRIAEWLQTLPRPIGIMCSHDERGHRLLDACRRAHLKCPDDVAVIGVDNDLHLCNLSSPPLTSIDINPSRVGYEAAAILAKAMNGTQKKAPKKPILLGPPKGIVPRQSTDMLSVADPEVASAINYIRKNAINDIRVSEILARASGSPSTLERKIKNTLGRSIKAEITRIRLARAKSMLCDTELPIHKIAIRVGFANPKYFCDVFRKNEKMTATGYRKKFRETD